MLQELQQIFSNPIWTFAALVVTIVAIILAIIFFIKGKKAKKPAYFIRSYNLVTDFNSKVTQLKMLYDNTPIKRLTASKIAFWNDGSETINKEDITETEPLMIQAVGDCEILDAKVIKEVNSVNKFHIEISNNKSVKILFDFLDKGQGGALQIMHTGKDSSDIKVAGFIKGAGEPKASYTTDLLTRIIRRLSPTPQPKKENPKKMRRMLGVFLLMYAIFMIIPIASDLRPTNIIPGLIFISILLYICYYLLKPRVPRGLEIVEEED